MSDDQDTIDRSMAELRQLKAERMTDAQLAANVATYRSSAPGTDNAVWRDTCEAELAHRKARLGPLDQFVLDAATDCVNATTHQGDLP